MKRISFIAAIAVIIALLSVFPASAAGADVWDGTFPTADKTGKYSGGEGTEESPYLISSAADLAMLSSVTAAGESYEGKYFKITTDITLNSDHAGYAGWGTTPPKNAWRAIGENAGNKVSGGSFAGHINGAGHVIRGMYVNDESAGWDKAAAGFIGCLRGSVINLGFENCYVKRNNTAGNGAGIIVTYLGHSGSTLRGNITACYVKNCTVESWRCPGLIAGVVYSGRISDCFSEGQVVIGRTDKEADGGGIAGMISAKELGEIMNCYTLATMNDAPVTGPVVGNVSGLGTVENAYYDPAISTVNKAYIANDAKDYVAVTPLAKAEMKVQAMKLDANVWKDTAGTPVLKIFGNSGNQGGNKPTPPTADGISAVITVIAAAGAVAVLTAKKRRG